MEADALVRDYLARLETAAAALRPDRRAELVGEVREHVQVALAEAGRADEATVRNVLDRLGSPDEIVAAEAGQSSASGGAALVSPTPPATRERWGRVEIGAVALLCLAWPAFFVPIVGPWLWLGLGAVGLILVWVSGVWSTRRKLTSSICVVALYLLLFVLTYPASVQCTTGNPPQACPPGGPSPVATGV